MSHCTLSYQNLDHAKKESSPFCRFQSFPSALQTMVSKHDWYKTCSAKWAEIKVDDANVVAFYDQMEVEIQQRDESESKASKRLDFMWGIKSLIFDRDPLYLAT